MFFVLLFVVYSGPWVADAKRYFSRPGCAAYRLAGKYLNGEVDRQDYLETAIRWIVKSEKPEIVEKYMGHHQGDEAETELWLYFQKVVNWTTTLFPAYRREMKGLDWGRFYAKYGTRKYNPVALVTTYEGGIAVTNHHEIPAGKRKTRTGWPQGLANTGFTGLFKWSQVTDSNRRPAHYE